jgi:hypothetical protein
VATGALAWSRRWGLPAVTGFGLRPFRRGARTWKSGLHSDPQGPERIELANRSLRRWPRGQLTKARAKGLVPDLPDAVGTKWGNNGDRIYAWIGMNGDAGSEQGGPACVGGRDEESAIPYTVVHAGSPVQPPGVKLMTVVGFGIVDPVGT